MKHIGKVTLTGIVLLSMACILVCSASISATSSSIYSTNSTLISGTIIDISESLTNGGSSVTVTLDVAEGSISDSYLHLKVEVFEDNAWQQKMIRSMSTGPLGGDNGTGTSSTFVFSNISVSGDPDYKLTVIWSEDSPGMTNVIDEMVGGHYRVSTLSTISLIALCIALGIMASYYMRKEIRPNVS